jgi:hypothetical protein
MISSGCRERFARLAFVSRREARAALDARGGSRSAPERTPSGAWLLVVVGRLPGRGGANIPVAAGRPGATRARPTLSEETDGPFTESKELVAGFSIINLPSQDDARRWAEAYAEILGDNEVDVRQIADPA